MAEYIAELDSTEYVKVPITVVDHQTGESRKIGEGTLYKTPDSIIFKGRIDDDDLGLITGFAEGRFSGFNVEPTKPVSDNIYFEDKDKGP